MVKTSQRSYNTHTQAIPKNCPDKEPESRNVAIFVCFEGEGTKELEIREPQHTPVSHTLGIPVHPQMKEIPLYSVGLRVWGMFQGVCWKILSMLLSLGFQAPGEKFFFFRLVCG